MGGIDQEMEVSGFWTSKTKKSTKGEKIAEMSTSSVYFPGKKAPNRFLSFITTL
jgi:hypothetical protein